MDWRGYGRSDWQHRPYWLAEFIAVLDELVERLSPGAPVTLMASNPFLTAARAERIAGWITRAHPEGGVVLDADPWHRSVFNHLVLHPDHFFGAWSRVTAPTSGVTADESETRARFERAMGSQAEMHKRMQRLPRLRSHRLAQAGHNLQHDQPEALAAVIEAFLDEA